MFNNGVDPIFQSVNLQPQVQFQSSYWSNSAHHNKSLAFIVETGVTIQFESTQFRVW